MPKAGHSPLATCHSPLSLLALWLSFVAGALAAEAPDIECVWPLFYYRNGAGRTEVDVLGPLGYYVRDAKATSYGMRPLFDVVSEPEEKRGSFHVLYPIASFRGSPQSAWHFVFPFYFHNHRVAANGQPASATVIFPFVWWGRSATEGPWGAILLVGGTFKGLFGADRVDYGGFTYSKVRTGEYTTYLILWPFGTYWTGPDKHGLRIWPFYCHVTHEGHWSNGYVMWPFCCYGSREGGEARDAASYFASWPFFGLSRGRDGRSGSVQVLWPLFYYGWNERGNFREWQGPWPLFSKKTSDDVSSFNLWPFWGRARERARVEDRFLSGLVRHTSVDAKASTVRETTVFPFFTHSLSEDRRRESRRSFWLLWPFWRSRSFREGTASWGDANCLQFAWTRATDDFDRNWSALLGLLEHERRRDGEAATRVAMRLFRHETGPGWSHTQLGPFASWQSAPGLTRLSFMLGLVQTGQRDGRRGWRVFFIPFGARLSAR
ncbi:MAG: hypothetical protein FJ291_13635 [Planctomycetes bacterium]|nr:hypothetical protein [Planctomycetota bacterium]